MRAKTLFPKIKDAGFTLLEVMIVLALLAGMTGLMVSRFVSKGNDNKKFVRQFTLVSKEIQYQAKLFNSTYRLVIDLDSNEAEEIPQRFWVEKASSQGVVLEEEDLEKTRDKKKKKTTAFEIDQRVFKEIQKVPDSLRITHVELTREEKPFQEGKVFIYFLPQGLVDEAAIHFAMGDEKQWTVVTNPLSGKSDYIGRNVPLKEVRDR